MGFTLTYLEEVDDKSPQSAYGFSLEGGKAQSVFLLENPEQLDLITAIQDILGQAYQGPVTGPNAGRRAIQPPMQHPIYPWLYASAISNFRGVGTYTKVAANPTDPPSDNQLPNFALYEQYLITVEFTPRNYDLLLDTDIDVLQGSWYPETGGGTSAVTYNYCTEYYRYTDVEIAMKDDVVSAQQGSMKFNSSTQANNAVYPAPVSMFLPNQVLRVIWYFVPYRYITSSNSYITGGSDPRDDGTATWPARPTWLGRVNQNVVNISTMTFPVGSLLYLHYNVHKYTPPVNQQQPIFSNTNIQTWSKLCNVTFDFLLTNRVLQSGETLATPPTNKNFVTTGHNLQPWFADRQYHYAETEPGSQLGTIPNTPSWLSAPLELLFFDPDVRNNGV